VNQEKTKYILMSLSHKIGQKHSIKIVNRSFEDVGRFRYQNTYQVQIACRLRADKIWEMLAAIWLKSLLSSHLLCRNVKVKFTKL
jgi:hypothetical protein